MSFILPPYPRSNWALAATAPVLRSTGSQPSLGTTGKIATTFWKRHGQMCDFQIFMQFGSSGAAAGTGNYAIDFTIPKWSGAAGQESFDTEWLIDNFYISSYPNFQLKGTFNDVSSLGSVPMIFSMDNAQPMTLYPAYPWGASGTYVSQGSVWSATVPAIPAAGDQISVAGSIPIIGWREF